MHESVSSGTPTPQNTPSPRDFPRSDAVRPPPSLARVPRLYAAKWPPDDDALPPGSVGGGGYAGGGDGNFKRGRFAPVAILIGILAASGIAAAVVFGSMKDSEKMDPKKVAQEK